jgi:hypothetical protein
LGIKGRDTLAIYLIISFFFVLAAHIFFRKRTHDLGPNERTALKRKTLTDWIGVISHTLMGTMYVSIVSLAAVSFGILTALFDSTGSFDPTEGFGILLGIGSAFLLITLIFITFAINRAKREGLWNYGKEDENNFIFIEPKKVYNGFIASIFLILFFILSLSLVSINVRYNSMAASLMVLVSLSFIFLFYKDRPRFRDFLLWGICAAVMIRLLTVADPMETTISIFKVTKLSGVLSDLVLSVICLCIVYLIWTRDTIKVYSELNRFSPILFCSLSLVFFVTPEATLGRYLVPLSLLITAFKCKDSVSYPFALAIFLVTFYIFTGNPSTAGTTILDLSNFSRRILLLIVMGIILISVLFTHKLWGREPITGETGIGLSLGIFIFALIAFASRENGQWIISVVWGSLGLCLAFSGFYLKKPYLRWMSLGTIVIVLGKIALYDSSNLDLKYRVAVFLVTGIILILVSSLYFKLLEKEKSQGKIFEKPDQYR